MTFTYLGTGATALDRIRIAIGDVKSSNPILQDETITYLLGVYPSERRAAIEACDAALASLNDMADDRQDAAQVFWSQVRANFARRKRELRANLAKNLLPYVGGISQGEKVGDDADDDLVQPLFRKRRDLLDPPSPFEDPLLGQPS